MSLKEKIKENVVLVLIIGSITFVAGGFGTYAMTSLGKADKLENKIEVQDVRLIELCNRVTEMNGKFGNTDVTLMRLEKAITRLETIVERLEKE